MNAGAVVEGTRPLPCPVILAKLRHFVAGSPVTAAFLNAGATSEMPISSRGESIAISQSTEITTLPFELIITGTSTVSPGLASHDPKSNTTSAADAFLFAETPFTSPILTLGCVAV